MEKFKKQIKGFLKETEELLDKLDVDEINKAANLLLECYDKKKKVFAAGNGGSASTAQHFACDLSKYVIPQGKQPFDARSLTDNVSLYTAWANDANRDDVFVNMMKGLINEGDVLILISVHGGAGFSADLVKALRYAQKEGASVIALVGFDGGMLHKEADCSILVPVESTPQSEAIHLVIEHLLMFIIKDELAKRK
jgi:D-sedoheptulose 7-phosphate isomerase